MIVVPRHWDLHEENDLRVVPAPVGHLVLECEVSQPPSSKRRTVYVYFEPEDVVRLIKEARSVAIAARSTTLTEAERSG